ncbi:MAG: YciI family protein [Gemmobacter sp.]|uniref:YciI family protein n=1 Tax=Gemmobacter sp. TaxID=1898957 RepID=UPI00391DD1D3
MPFVLLCQDKPGALQTRLDNRPAHLDYLNASGVVLFAGPFVEGGNPVGSMVVVDLPDMAAARAFAEADPYARAGLFASVSIREWRKAIG